MKLDTFFEKFERFADAPDAVAKMRSLLIHFAVSGKLVLNDPSDQPVRLQLSGRSAEDFKLPENWSTGLVGEVFTFEYGDNLPAPKRSATGEYPVYGSNGIVGTHDTYLTREPAIIIGRKGSAGALNIATGPSWTTDVRPTLSVFPSVDATTRGRRCHYFIRRGRTIWIRDQER